jgi:hypothetical protein
MGCAGSREHAPPVKRMQPPQPIAPPRPQSTESDAARDQRRKEAAIREAATTEMIRRIEQDAALMLELREPLEAEMSRAGLLNEVTECWPPRRIEAKLVLEPSALDVEGYKAIQRKRYVREAYENALGRLGRQMMLRQGWRPWNHCMVRSDAARSRIALIFIAWTLKASAQLCVLPRDLLYMLFTWVAAEQ